MSDRGPNDLEEKIRVLEFRNAKLHQHNEKIEREILELRDKIKKLGFQPKISIEEGIQLLMESYKNG
jgi:nucleoside-diphosphate-sugar epimerase